MIELVPYMLMLAWAAPGQTGKVEIERANELFASAEACERAASAFVAATRHAGVTHACLPVPGPEEFDSLFRRLEAQDRKARPENGQ